MSGEVVGKLLSYIVFCVGAAMPIYEYRCGACGHQQEFLQRLNDAPLKDCPKCGKPELSKLVSAAGFQLKGTGWYATDFKNKGAKPATKPATKDKQEKSSTETSGGDSAKSDSPKSEASCGTGACPACS